jgi:hypothetical protein
LLGLFARAILPPENVLKQILSGSGPIRGLYRPLTLFNAGLNGGQNHLPCRIVHICLSGCCSFVGKLSNAQTCSLCGKSSRYGIGLDVDVEVQSKGNKHLKKIALFAIDTERIGDYAPRSYTDLGDDVFESFYKRQRVVNGNVFESVTLLIALLYIR